MACTIVIILRVTRFLALSAAKPSQLRSSAEWQSSQDMPSDAEKNPIVDMNWSTGIPLSTWTSLKTSCDISGFSGAT